jgi:hypothetical protein
MATPMNSADFRAAVEPILNHHFDGVYDQRDDEWKDIFSTDTTATVAAYHEEPVLYGMGMAPILPEGQAVSYDRGGTHYIKRYQYDVVGLAFAITRILQEDGDDIKVGTLFSKHLAQSMMETKETRCANHLNRAFNTSYLGGDGKALLVSDHPMIGGSYSNILATAAALSQTSLEQLLINIRGATDARGKKMKLVGQQLIVPPALEFTADMILNSELTPHSANNAKNTVKGKLKKGVKVISRLTSTTAWFVQTNAPEGMKMLSRRKLEKTMEGDFESDSMRYKVTERYGEGWTDPRCMYGTAGL